MKYRNQRSNGYASKREEKRAFDLKILLRVGEITDLQEQVKYEVLPKQLDVDGKTIERPVHYIADFVYKTREGVMVVEDTKGFKTKDYILKRKLMLYRHGIQVREL